MNVERMLEQRAIPRVIYHESLFDENYPYTVAFSPEACADFLFSNGMSSENVSRLSMLITGERISVFDAASYNPINRSITLPALSLVSTDKFQLLKNFMKDRDKFDLKLFSPSLTPEIAPFFDRAYLIELPQFLNDEKLFLRELDKTVKEIKKISLRRTVGEISTKLNRLEDEQKSSEADQLNKEIKKLFIKLKELEK